MKMALIPQLPSYEDPDYSDPRTRLPLEICVHVTVKNNVPALELRTATTDPVLIKIIVQRIREGETITLCPKFTDKVKACNSLLEKGIIYYNPLDDNYYFTF